MGSKARIAKYILPIILKDRKEGQWYVEPFVGGANMIDKVDGNRIGADLNEYLIECLIALKNNWLPPKEISKELYLDIKKNMKKYDKSLVGYVGFQLSYGAIWFGSYRRDNIGKRNYSLEAYKNVFKQAKRLKGIIFKNCSYDELKIPNNSIIYCDPPYKNTAKYKSVSEFEYEKFWEWCRIKTREGHKVFISEYNAPKDFKCIWSKEIVSSLTKNTGSKKGIEKLFIYKGDSNDR